MIEKVKTKLGLIGVGSHMEKQLIPAIRLNKDARISAIYSSDKDKLARLGYELDCESQNLYTDWKKLIKDARIDAIIASGDPVFHTQVAKYAVKNNMPFFVEKPPLSSLKDFDYFEGKELPVNMVGYNFKYSSVYQELLDRIKSNDGIRSASFELSHNQPNEVIWNKETIIESFLYRLGIHVIDQVVGLFGEVSDIGCSITRLDTTKFELDVKLFFGDKVVNLKLGNNSNNLCYNAKLFNSAGNSSWFENFRDIHILNSGGSSVIKHFCLDGGYSRTGYQGEIDHFVECVRENKPTSSPILASKHTYEVIEQILELIPNKLKI
jgi:predicted dehydrogenase